MPSERLIQCQHGVTRNARTYLFAKLQQQSTLHYPKECFHCPWKLHQNSLLIKGHNLDWNVLNNYWPVSNLSYLSQIIERAVAVQLNNYLLDSSKHTESTQSAYWTGHSAETGKIHVKNDIRISIDLSAAFDTVDQNVLFGWFEKIFGLSGKALEWFQSYLKEYSQRVSVQGALSDVLCLFCGSVLGPLIFTMYTWPHGIIAR